MQYATSCVEEEEVEEEEGGLHPVRQDHRSVT
jgi:hypothetical protein